MSSEVFGDLQFMLALGATAILTLGASYVFYPAFQAAFQDRLEYDTVQLSQQNGDEAPTNILLSLVIPAYNEEERIPIMLQAAHEYLESKDGRKTLQTLQQCSTLLGYEETTAKPPKLAVEWMIVNDGSKDGTDPTVRKEQDRLQKASSNDDKRYPHVWRLLNLKQNGGKGAAVKAGMTAAKGSFRLMVDADGATDFGPGLERVVTSLSKSIQSSSSSSASSDKARTDAASSINTMLAVFGSRAHMKNKAEAERSFLRTLLMHAFHFFVSVLISSQIQDTQCGFKLFTQDSAASCFSKLHLRRWAFDTEIVILSAYQGTQIMEVGVPWQEIDGSKLHTSKLALAMVSISMLRDMLCVRLCYSLRIWNASK